MLHYPFNERSFERERHEHESSRYVTAPGGGARNREAAGRAHLLYLGEDTDAEAVERPSSSSGLFSALWLGVTCGSFDET